MPRKLTKAPAGSLTTSNSTASSSAASTTSPLPTVLTDPCPLPKLIVFDLDYTLWPFWVDTHVYPPLKAKPSSTASAIDKLGESFAFYADVPSVLSALSSCPHTKLAIASRTSAPDLGAQLLKILHVPSLFHHTIDPQTASGSSSSSSSSSRKANKPRRAIDLFDAGLEIYPSSKIRHFEALHKRTGIAYSDMLFFDDEARNRDTESLGVTMWLVRDGVTWAELESGIREWRRRRGHNGAPR